MLFDRYGSQHELIHALSKAIDLVSPSVADHHKTVAYISLCIADQIRLNEKNTENLVIAAMLHDCGALSQKERLDALAFELQNPYLHAVMGAELLGSHALFSTVAEIVRNHHTPWEAGQDCSENSDSVCLESRIIHLADRISVLIDSEHSILAQRKEITERINKFSKTYFDPDLVDVFNDLSKREGFWLDINFKEMESRISHIFDHRPSTTLDSMKNLTELIMHIIDFRSSFTATHSSGVAASARALAQECCFSEEECEMMYMAGNLHDLGKLAVPKEILEKNGRLEPEEFRVIRTHTYHTYRILKDVSGMETINRWASFHHERLDGRGYPFHLDQFQLGIGSRIMAVADVFTALTENRPYRKSMPADKTLEILHRMVQDDALDAQVVDVLERNFDIINGFRRVAQREAALWFNSFLARVDEQMKFNFPENHLEELATPPQYFA